MALAALQALGRPVAALMTTVTSDYDRISMHGVRRELLRRQADAIGLPLHEVFIPANAANGEYEAATGEALSMFRDQGLKTIAFGDLFLADIRAYRDRLVEQNGMRAIYPVWGEETGAFLQDFIGRGFEAVTTCIDLAALDDRFLGRRIDASFLADLPDGVDPCGENGEYHSFVFNGPIFRRPVEFQIGQRVTRGGFRFCDLEPAPLWTAASSETEFQPC